MKCRLILENGETYIYSSGYQYSETLIEFTETDANDQSMTSYLLERIDDKRTLLTINYHIRRNFSSKIRFALSGKTRLIENMNKSLDNLSRLVQDLKIPLVAAT